MTPWDWALVSIGALFVGLAKGGLVGIGNLSIIWFAMVFGAKESVGILLPILIAADLVAIVIYRHHASWSHLRAVLPWMTLGILIGYFFFDRMSARAIELAVGWIVLLLTLLQMLRSYARHFGHGDFAQRLPHSRGYRLGLGISGGFASMVANAAGPIGQLYFISVGLPKMAFIGTGVWCFFVVNMLKLPLQIELGIVQLESLRTSLLLAPLAIAGAFLAPLLVRFIPERIFAAAVWFFIVVAALKLIFP